MEKLNAQDLELVNIYIQHIYSLRNLPDFPEWIMTLLKEVLPAEEYLCSTYSDKAYVLYGEAIDSYINTLTPEFFRDHPALQHYYTTGYSIPHKISDYISEQEFLNREGLYETFYARHGIRDQLAFAVSDRRQPQNVVLSRAKSEVVLVDRLKLWVDGSLDADDVSSMCSLVLEPKPMLENLYFAFDRTRRSFTERDRSVLILLQPHIAVAYGNAQQYTKLQQQLQQQAVDRLNTIVLTVTGAVNLMPETEINLLRHFFADEWMDEQHLPDTLSNWLQQQLRIGRSEVLVPMHPWQVNRGSRQLEIELLCDFGAERHLLVLTEQSIALPLAQQLRRIGLTNREAEVLMSISAGKTNLQIAQELTISLQTVKKHVANIFGKLNAQNRTDAVNKAMQQVDD
jgi:DNA-binding CsgD family transcriptional regulator/GAF domain-containing protein